LLVLSRDSFLALVLQPSALLLEYRYSTKEEGGSMTSLASSLPFRSVFISTLLVLDLLLFLWY